MDRQHILDELTVNMIVYEDSAARIQHLLKVHSFARLIGVGEGLDEDTLFTLETASIVHDIGIKPAIRIYGSGDAEV